MSPAASPYCYSSLWPGSNIIRMLRLMPHEDENAPIHCQLFNYTLHETPRGSHLYEALSYVWGSTDKPQSIVIDNHELPVTANLHAALRHLRDCFIERVIWIDALCINQGSKDERSRQIQLISKIYSHAARVVVWLGDAADNSDHALEIIRTAASIRSDFSFHEPSVHREIEKLLERPWFRRIWVLQEVAAARHIVVSCGTSEIDGYVFGSGLTVLKRHPIVHLNSRPLIDRVIYLMGGAIFRPKTMSGDSLGRAALNIAPLGELIDMYHAHEATEHHGKVFALLGMGSDNPVAAGLLPDYKLSWEVLFKQLVHFLLGRDVSVETWPGTEIALIESKGCVIGKVASLNVSDDDSRQDVNIITSKNMTGPLSPKTRWTTPMSAKPVQVGDLVCLLHGAAKAVVVRPYDDHFSVIRVTVPLEMEQPITTFVHDFRLIWDWKMDTSGDQKHPKTVIPEAVGGHLSKTIRSEKATGILEDAEEYQKAEEKFQKAVSGYTRALGQDRLALMYRKMNRSEDAKTLLKNVARVRNQVEHTDPDTVNGTLNLVSICKNQQQQNEEERRGTMASILKGDKTSLTEDGMAHAVLLLGTEVIESLINENRDMVNITEGVAISAAGNKLRGKEIISLLLSQMGDKTQVSERVAIAAAGNARCGREIMSLLLNEKGDEFKITERVLAAAAGNTQSGKEVMSFLFSQREDQLHITEGVATVAAANWRQGKEIISFLISQKRHEVPITKGVVTVAAGNRLNGRQIICILLEHKGKVNITEGVVTPAATENTDQQGYVTLATLWLNHKIVNHVTDAAVSCIIRYFDLETEPFA